MKQRKKAAPATAARDRRWLTALILCAVTFLAFLSSFDAGFPMDNRPLLMADPRIREATLHNIGLILSHSYWWPTGEAGLYRPFTTLTYLFNYAVLGNAAAGYHWINLLLHMGNVLLLWALALRLLKAPVPAALLAGLWAVHPLVTESVTNIVGRADLLAGISTIGGLLLYMKGTEAVGWRKAAWFVSLGLVTLFGVFSKESAVVIVGVIALYELIWWRERKQWRDLMYGMIATGVPVALMLTARWRVLSRSLPAEFPFLDNPITAADFITAKLTALKVVAHYLWLVLWPAGLSSDYSYPQIPLASGTAGDWAAWLTVAAAVALITMCARWSRTALFFALLAAGAFLPASNLLFPIGTIMAERLFYVPLMGVLACLVIAAFRIGSRFRVERGVPIALAVVALALAARTYARNLDWKDDRTLAEASLKAAPKSYKLHNALAKDLIADHPNPSTIDQTIGEAERSVELIGNVPDAMSSADPWRADGTAWLAKGDLQRTPADVNRGLPAPAEAMRAYGTARERLLRAAAIDQAAHNAFRKRMEALRARGYSGAPPDEGDAAVYELLSMVEMRAGDVPRSVEAARRALQLHPEGAEAFRQIYYSLASAGQLEEAAVALFEGEFETADPSLMPDLVNLYRNGLNKDSCAVMNGPSGPTINPGCPIVRKDMCTAGTAVLLEAERADRPELAANQKQAMREIGCPIVQ